MPGRIAIENEVLRQTLNKSLSEYSKEKLTSAAKNLIKSRTMDLKVNTMRGKAALSFDDIHLGNGLALIHETFDDKDGTQYLQDSVNRFKDIGVANGLARAMTERTNMTIQNADWIDANRELKTISDFDLFGTQHPYVLAQAQILS